MNMSVKDMFDICTAGDHFAEKMSIPNSQMVLRWHPDIEWRVMHEQIDGLVRGSRKLLIKPGSTPGAI
jgi:hypothetical protein